MTRTLLLFRHADASRPPGIADHDRDLSPRGEEQAHAAGRWLAGEGLVPDRAVVSPSVRTTRTWALASAQLDRAPDVAVEPAVYAATTEDLVAVVRALPDEVATALVCGHNPGLSDLAQWLGLDGAGDVPEPLRRAVRGGLRKGAVAVLVAPDLTSWAAADAGSFPVRQVWPA